MCLVSEFLLALLTSVSDLCVFVCVRFRLVRVGETETDSENKTEEPVKS